MEPIQDGHASLRLPPGIRKAGEEIARDPNSLQLSLIEVPPRLTRCVRQCMQEFVTPTHSGISDSSWWACHPLLLPGMCTLTYFHHWMSHPCTYGHQQRTHKISSTLNLLHIPPFGRRSESFTCTIYTKDECNPTYLWSYDI